MKELDEELDALLQEEDDFSDVEELVFDPLAPETILFEFGLLAGMEGRISSNGEQE